MAAPDHDLLYRIFESISPSAKWAISFLTAGIYLLVRFIWRRHMERLKAIEEQQEKFATKPDIQRVERAVSEVHTRVDKIILHLGIDQNHKRG